MKANKKSRLFSVVLIISMLIGLLATNVNAATIVEEADVLVSYPVHLASPDGYAQIYGGTCRVDTSINSSGYVNGVRWKDLRTGEYMDENDIFVGGRDYELSIRLITQTGYNFSNTRTVITVNMDPATVVITDLNHATVTVTVIADELYINYTDIVGLNYPAVDDAPDTDFGTENDDCTVLGATWTDLTDGTTLPEHGAKFKVGHAYKLSFSLFAKNGYIFPNNAAVFVSGKLATLKRNSNYELEVSLEYPALAELTPEHTHTPSEWRTTQVYHYKVCTSCGELLDQEDHKGGIATCNEKGRCTVCSYAYIEETENHVPNTDSWIQRGDMYHYHACKICGAHCDVEDHRWSPKYHSVGANGHAYECADCHAYSEVIPHEPGPAGTPDAETVCKYCGYIIAPPIGHEHNLTKVDKKDPTCIDPGNIEYYTCDGCSCLFADSSEGTMLTEEEVVISPINHTVSDTWEHNGDYHWRTCTICHAVLTETKMAHKMTDGECVDCGYGRTPDNTTSGNLNSGNGKDNGSDVIITITIILFIVLIGTIVTYVIIKNKKANK